jgi:hypothetical protein
MSAQPQAQAPDFSAFPQFSQFPQGMDFLKQYWTSASQPSSAPAAGFASSAAAPGAAPTPAFQQAMAQYLMPTFDLAELDKRMADLRVVLQFMELNTNLLRQSLHALEVQRNTLATLQSMAATRSDSANPAQAQGSQSAPNPAAPWLAAWQAMMQGAAPEAAPSSAKTPTKRKRATRTK